MCHYVHLLACLFPQSSVLVLQAAALTISAAGKTVMLFRECTGTKFGINLRGEKDKGMYVFSRERSETAMLNV